MCALEAMCLGTPIVSTPSDGMKDIVENGVSGYLTDDDAVMAQKLLKIMDDPEHRRTLSDNGKAIFARINDEQHYQEAIAACYR